MLLHLQGGNLIITCLSV